MVIMWEHLTIQRTLTALELDIFQKKFKSLYKSNQDFTKMIVRIQSYDATKSEYFCIGFTEFMLKVRFARV